MGFNFKKTKIQGLALISVDRFHDDRGFFQECYRRETFLDFGLPEFVQENQARSRLNVLRGLHYQLNPAAQGKLVRCLNGRIFDVAVDIRKSSPTFGDWFGVELSEDNYQMLYVPAGFAHGYCALTDAAEVLYKTTSYWSPQHERAIRWDDPRIAINWPVPSPIVSEKDSRAPGLDHAENNFV